MKIAKFYRHKLGVKIPWEIKKAKIDSKDKGVHINLSPENGEKFLCKHCKKLY